MGAPTTKENRFSQYYHAAKEKLKQSEIKRREKRIADREDKIWKMAEEAALIRAENARRQKYLEAAERLVEARDEERRQNKRLERLRQGKTTRRKTTTRKTQKKTVAKSTRKKTQARKTQKKTTSRRQTRRRRT